MHYMSLVFAAVAIRKTLAASFSDVLSAHSDTLSLFSQMVDRANLRDTINSYDASTIFVPTNDALQAAITDIPDMLVSKAGR
jgi:uncharacterized surface protein with fasciclin (FAS1) repeats